MRHQNRHLLLATFAVFVLLSLLSCGGLGFGTDSSSSETNVNQWAGTTLKAGYVPYPPGCIKDPNTGELSGIFVEALEKAAENLEIELVWSEEVGWGTMIEGLKTGRYDLIGSPVWANTSRAKHAAFSTPLYYSGIGVFVRRDEQRFEGVGDLNDSNYTVSVMDGEMSLIIAQSDFPRAKQTSIPQLSDVSQLLLEVSQGKADATFVETFIASKFLKNNPGSVKNLVPDEPIRVFPNTMMLRPTDTNLRRVLNAALEELHNNGEIDRLMTKYTASNDSFYPVALPYRKP